MSEFFKPNAGDLIMCAVGRNKDPIWDYSNLYIENFSEFVLCKVVSVDLSDASYFVEGVGFDLGWHFPFRYEHENKDYINRYAEKVSAVAPPVITPSWIEIIRHNPKQVIPQSVIDAAIERGEAGVRRVLRSWPDGKKLLARKKTEEDHMIIEWFFADAE